MIPGLPVSHLIRPNGDRSGFDRRHDRVPGLIDEGDFHDPTTEERTDRDCLIRSFESCPAFQ